MKGEEERKNGGRTEEERKRRRRGGEEERREEKKIRDPHNHRPDPSSVPVFRADLEGNNNQGHSGKWMQHRYPPGKTHWLYFFD